MLIAIHSLLGDVNVTPTTSGMPGAELVQKLLNWLTQIALWGSLASILCGAAIYGLSSRRATTPAGTSARSSRWPGRSGRALRVSLRRRSISCSRRPSDRATGRGGPARGAQHHAVRVWSSTTRTEHTDAGRAERGATRRRCRRRRHRHRQRRRRGGAIRVFGPATSRHVADSIGRCGAVHVERRVGGRRARRDT